MILKIEKFRKILNVTKIEKKEERIVLIKMRCLNIIKEYSIREESILLKHDHELCGIKICGSFSSWYDLFFEYEVLSDL